MALNVSYKIALVGDARVGKTSLVRRYMGKGYSTSYLPTMGVDFSINKIKRNNRNYVLQIWDMAGQKKFEEIRVRYLVGVVILLVVYDITNRTSFSHVMDWLRESFEVIRPENVSVVLVGNKFDLEDQRSIEEESIQELLELIKNKYQGVQYLTEIKTSALSGYQITKAFEDILDHIDL